MPAIKQNGIKVTNEVSGTGRVKLVIAPGAITSIYNTNFTNIDNASGYPIQVFGRSLPTLTTSGNWIPRTLVLGNPGVFAGGGPNCYIDVVMYYEKIQF